MRYFHIKYNDSYRLTDTERRLMVDRGEGGRGHSEKGEGIKKY